MIYQRIMAEKAEKEKEKQNQNQNQNNDENQEPINNEHKQQPLQPGNNNGPKSSFMNKDISYPESSLFKTWKINNNGHSIVLHPIEEVSDLGDDLETTYIGLTLNENTIAKFPNYFALTDNHKEYCFAGLHFHWGTLDKTSSEHLVDGEKRIKYILTLYSDHASAGTTLEQFETGDDVITAFFDIVFDIVDDRINPAFGIILNNLTLNNIMFNSNNTFIYDFDLSQLIPDRVNTEGYYAYKGNLTTPPCTNIVNWHVMNAHGYIADHNGKI